MLEAALRHDGFDVHPAANGREALDAVRERPAPDLIVLDVMMPDLDGFEVCRRLRTDGDPHAGAVPHRPRRHRGQGARPDPRRRRLPREAVQPRGARRPHRARCCGAPGSTRAPARCCAAPTSRWTTTPTASRRAGAEVPLSPTEYNLLRYLLVNQGRVLSKAQILDHVWQYDFGGDGGVVETYIGYLRRKVDNVEPQLIHTIRGVGLHAAPEHDGVADVAAGPPARWAWRSSSSCSSPSRSSITITDASHLVDQVDDRLERSAASPPDQDDRRGPRRGRRAAFPSEAGAGPSRPTGSATSTKASSTATGVWSPASHPTSARRDRPARFSPPPTCPRPDGRSSPSTRSASSDTLPRARRALDGDRRRRHRAPASTTS